MDLTLLAITVVSLVALIVMGVWVWRVSRDERRRGAARVAALGAAASEPAPVRSVVSRTVEEPVDEHRIVVGGGRPVAPWTPARVSTIAPSRRVQGGVDPVKPVPASEFHLERASVCESFLGSATTSPASGGQRGLAIAAVVLFALVVTGGFWLVFGDRRSLGGGWSTTATAVAASPLELVSLRHERRGTRLAVTGLIRNPGAGVAVDKLTAVVFLFDQKGAFISSARADVDFRRLIPGDESPFVITLDAPATVARYRVSFRNDAGIVPHVDQRRAEPVSQSLAATVSP